MKTKIITLLMILPLLVASCGNNKSKKGETKEETKEFKNIVEKNNKIRQQKKEE